MNELTMYKRKRLKREGQKYEKSIRENKRFNKVKAHGRSVDFFNKVEVDKIEYLLIKNPEYALKHAEEYLINYPTDYYARTLLVGALVILRRFEEAKNEIEDIEASIYSDKNMKKDADRTEKNILSLGYSKIKYYMYTGDVRAAHDVIMSNPKLIATYGLEKTLFYIKHLLDEPDKMKYYGETYMYKQMNNYSELEMKWHIGKHMPRGNEDRDVPNTNIFVESFPVDDVLCEIEQYLTDENAVYSGLIEDDFYFKYDDCGKEENKYVNYFKVVCLHGTKKIITMLPVANYNELSYIDLNYMNSNSIDNCKQLVLKKKNDNK